MKRIVLSGWGQSRMKTGYTIEFSSVILSSQTFVIHSIV